MWFLCLSLLFSLQSVKALDFEKDAQEVYIYGYPLVLMDFTKNSFAEYKTNEFVNLREFPNPNFQDVVSPNADTLYSSAWLDLSKEPIILSVPEVLDRYYLIEILDGWTNVIGSVGTRTNGGKRRSYAIAGPFWQGTLPDDVQLIRSETSFAWILGRTETRGSKDYAAVHKIQDQYRLIPLSKWGTSQQSQSVNFMPSKAGVAPVDQVAKMDGAAFFTKLNELLNRDGPPSQDKEIAEKMLAIGFKPGASFSTAIVPAEQLNEAVRKGQEEIISSWKNEKFGHIANGWLMMTDKIGDYGTDYLLRAVIAYGGLGANLPQDAIYPVTRVDSRGELLNGSNRYVMHFDKAPPVKGFWSITMYNDKQFFISNPINRYKIGSLDNISKNSDGSFDIYIQKNSPGVDKESNWLPSPSGSFNLMMRLYAPESAILNGSWKPPAVKKAS